MAPGAHVRACVFCCRALSTAEAVRVRSSRGAAEAAHRACAVEHVEHRRERLDRRQQRFEASWERSIEGGASAFPNFPYARANNQAWRERVSPKLLNVVLQYAGDSPLLVLGETGTGKTSAIGARQWAERERLRREVLTGAEHQISFAYATGFDLSGCRRHSKIGDEAPLVERLMRADLAILDEHGFEPPAQDGEVLAVLDHRHRRGAPTVVLSGLTREAFAARYGGAALRRLTQDGLLCDLHPSARKGQVSRAG